MDAQEEQQLQQRRRVALNRTEPLLFWTQPPRAKKSLIVHLQFPVQNLALNVQRFIFATLALASLPYHAHAGCCSINTVPWLTFVSWMCRRVTSFILVFSGTKRYMWKLFKQEQ